MYLYSTTYWNKSRHLYPMKPLSNFYLSKRSFAIPLDTISSFQFHAYWCSGEMSQLGIRQNRQLWINTISFEKINNSKKTVQTWYLWFWNLAYLVNLNFSDLLPAKKNNMDTYSMCIAPVTRGLVVLTATLQQNSKRIRNNAILFVIYIRTQ